MVLDERFVIRNAATDERYLKAYRNSAEGKRWEGWPPAEAFGEVATFYEYVLTTASALLDEEKLDIGGEFDIYLFYLRQKLEEDPESFRVFIARLREYVFAQLDARVGDGPQSLYRLEHPLGRDDEVVRRETGEIERLFLSSPTIFNVWRQYELSYYLAVLDEAIDFPIYVLANFDKDVIPKLLIRMQDPFIWATLSFREELKYDWDVLLSLVESDDVKLASLGVVLYARLLESIPSVEAKKFREEIGRFAATSGASPRGLNGRSEEVADWRGLVGQHNLVEGEYERRVRTLNDSIYTKPPAVIASLFDGLVQYRWRSSESDVDRGIRDAVYYDFAKRVEISNSSVLEILWGFSSENFHDFDRGAARDLAYFWSLVLAAIEDDSIFSEALYKEISDTLGKYYKYYTDPYSQAATSELGLGYSYQIDFANLIIRYLYVRIKREGVSLFDEEIERLREDVCVLSSSVGRQVLVGISEGESPYNVLHDAYVRVSFRIWLLWWVTLSSRPGANGPLLGKESGKYSALLVEITRPFVLNVLWQSAGAEDSVTLGLIHYLSDNPFLGGAVLDFLNELLTEAQSIHQILSAKDRILRDALDSSGLFNHDEIMARFSTLMETDLRELTGDSIFTSIYQLALLAHAAPYASLFDRAYELRPDLPVPKDLIIGVSREFREYGTDSSSTVEDALAGQLIRGVRRYGPHYCQFFMELANAYDLKVLRDLASLLKIYH